MANVTYTLKEPKIKNDVTLIYLFYRYKGNRVKFSTGETINPDNWSSDRQRAKKNTATTANGKYGLNSFLDKLRDKCEEIYNQELSKGVPDTEVIKNGLREFINFNNPSIKAQNANGFYALIEKFISNEILYQGRKRAVTTIKGYKTTYKNLLEFEKKSNYRVNFETMNLTFFDKFISYLMTKEKGPNAANTLHKNIKNIKTFLNEAVERNLTQNLDFKRKKFNVKQVETYSVHLTENEILKLYNTDLSNEPNVEKARDLIVIGCFVGLRFSDYNRIKQENIIIKKGDTYISIITQKTKEPVLVPINPIIKEILEKYGGTPPPSVSNQKFNIYIKRAAELAKLTEVGRLINEPEKPLFKCISSHTARRSFATNLFLERKLKVQEIMQITGHKSERTFMNYVKVTNEQTAELMNEHIKRKWSKKKIKVHKI